MTISHTETYKNVRPWAVLLKGGLLFVAVNLLFALPWSQQLGRWTLYNRLVPGLPRFSGTTDLDALFSTHAVAAEKQADEFRVFLMGDSATWGFLLDYRDTLAYRLDTAGLQTCSGKRLRVYNLASPSPSALKDLILMERAMAYQPDLFVWFVTLKSFTDFNKRGAIDQPFPYGITEVGEQIAFPLVLNNLDEVSSLIDKYHIQYPLPRVATNRVWDKTLLGQRSHLADLLDVQLSSLQWGATLLNSGTSLRDPGWDKPISEKPIKADLAFRELKSPVDISQHMRLDIFNAALKAQGYPPIMVVNNPMYVTDKPVKRIRYNEVYPRWAYDQYRKLMLDRSQKNGWAYLDLWDIVPSEHFSNSSFHRDAVGDEIVAKNIAPVILQMTCPNP
ncbi:MAG: hypothetical protein LC138_07235 [Anaerolineales bacterium]|jgi:hypothetical protein|nr:hypothetical protein [Anaerolineales bacterium]OQY87066.1 MAG: hypothetical protein B6D40_00230 [Anaerolineae bacterium UTCFX3]WKZ51149.1 MAG: hypothetical protein QY329_00185 [Anaerolineales bacterium]HPP64160.1 hypothetical protein [Anaerolineales bacterium]